MAYCDCANKHKPGCPNDKPGGLPPLRIEDDKRKGSGKNDKRKGK